MAKIKAKQIDSVKLNQVEDLSVLKTEKVLNITGNTITLTTISEKEIQDEISIEVNGITYELNKHFTRNGLKLTWTFDSINGGFDLESDMDILVKVGTSVGKSNEEVIKANSIVYDNSTTPELSTNVQEAVQQIFQSASKGKELFASTLTAKGVQANSNETFDELNTKLDSLEVLNVTGMEKISVKYKDDLNKGDIARAIDLSAYFQPLSLPADAPTRACKKMAYSPDGKYLAITISSSPYLLLYKIEEDGTKTKLDSTLGTGGLSEAIPASSGSCTFSPDGNLLVVTCSSSPYLVAYKREGDNFTRLNTFNTLPANETTCCTFNNDGTRLVMGLNYTSPYNICYTVEGDNFTKSSFGVSTSYTPDVAIEYSSDGNYILLVDTRTQNIKPDVIKVKEDGSYTRNGISLTETVPGMMTGGSFSPNADYLAVSHRTSPYITVYKREGDTFTKIPDAFDVLPTANTTKCKFSNDGTLLIVTFSDSTNKKYQKVYKNENGKFTELSLFDFQYAINDVVFSPDDKYLDFSFSYDTYIKSYKNESDPGFTGVYKQTGITDEISSSDGLCIINESGLKGDIKLATKIL